jgi:hypothetical protein
MDLQKVKKINSRLNNREQMQFKFKKMVELGEDTQGMRVQLLKRS